ncbi:LPS translocon maturation chaperone LptM [Vreelandella neptunia]|uniref:Lipoprotein n=1 Tax=Vreelandella neptunia TaxID=115551 RepID=A0ABS9S7D8_9GAMM|nr:lipoprotein [Halomonas neptunia]MCH4812032.1 lipoprotein [Halomonas neptunia]
MKALAILTLAALLLTGLAGCGQKGPLYLPEDAPADEQPSE